MGSATSAFESHSLYELSWNYAQDGKCAIDATTGIVVDANPAAEALTGYTRQQLIGMHITMLHPEAERERVTAEFPSAARHAAPSAGLHIQRSDGSCTLIEIRSSECLTLYGRSIAIIEFRDITVRDKSEKHLVPCITHNFG
jgi:PAS domain S-box-containing protein